MDDEGRRTDLRVARIFEWVFGGLAAGSMIVAALYLHGFVSWSLQGAPSDHVYDRGTLIGPLFPVVVFGGLWIACRRARRSLEG